MRVQNSGKFSVANLELVDVEIVYEHLVEWIVVLEIASLASSAETEFLSLGHPDARIAARWEYA